MEITSEQFSSIVHKGGRVLVTIGDTPTVEYLPLDVRGVVGSDGIITHTMILGHNLQDVLEAFLVKTEEDTIDWGNTVTPITQPEPELIEMSTELVFIGFDRLPRVMNLFRDMFSEWQWEKVCEVLDRPDVKSVDSMSITNWDSKEQMTYEYVLFNDMFLEKGDC